MSICPVQLVKECDEASQVVQKLLSTLMRDARFTRNASSLRAGSSSGSFSTEVDRLVSISVDLNGVVADVKSRLEEEIKEDE